MNWYYVQQGKQAGPVTEEQLDDMVRSGRMAADTLVWREGMAEWTPYQQAKGGAAAPAPAGVAVAEPTPEAVCAECGKIFPLEETINYGNVRICAACKPVFLQKLHEGAAIPTGDMRYAGFWTRFVAKFVDGVVMRLVLLPLTFLSPLMLKTTDPTKVLTYSVLSMTAGFLVGMAYSVFMTGKYGATLGKMALKVKVVTAEGRPITYGRAFGRFFAELLSGCPTLLIGYIMAGFDDQKRALHDRICNTRVVFK
jgi:uncharacterized RDD family membrane protein YckC